MTPDPVTLEWDLAPVPDPAGEQRCAFCGRPGDHQPCCHDHRRPMCDECRTVKGWHRDPPLHLYNGD